FVIGLLGGVAGGEGAAPADPLAAMFPDTGSKYLESQDLAGLFGSIEGARAGAKPRKAFTDNGFLNFFSAPRKGRIALGASLESAPAAEQALGFVAEHGAAFGVKSDSSGFTVLKVDTQPNRTFVRLSQTYANLPVYGAQMVVQVGKSGGIEAVVSDIMSRTFKLDDGRISLTATLSGEEAEDAALEAVASDPKISSVDGGISTDDLSIAKDAELMIFDPTVVGTKGDPRLVWRTEVIREEEVLAVPISGKTGPGEPTPVAMRTVDELV
ncbi:unnamed protein product, partial [marine sediment metagenome]